jgi:hypothetical protein
LKQISTDCIDARFVSDELLFSDKVQPGDCSYVQRSNGDLVLLCVLPGGKEIYAFPLLLKNDASRYFSTSGASVVDNTVFFEWDGNREKPTLREKIVTCRGGRHDSIGPRWEGYLKKGRFISC